MKRALLGSSLVVLALVIALSSTEGAGDLDTIKKRGELVIGVEAAFPPFESIQDGQMVGFDIDLSRAFAESLGVKVRFVDTSFPGLIPGLLEGKFDALISAVIITAERAKRVDFSQPYAEATETLVVRADDRAIKGKDDLRGKVVAVQSGTTVEKLTRELDDQFKKSGPGLKRIAVFDHAPEMFLDLDSKRSDVIVTLLPNFIAMNKKFPDRYRAVGDFAGKSYVGIVTRKDTRELSEFLDTKLGEMKKSGKLAELQAKWFGDRMSVPDKRLH